jgi:bifunctional non-homologous end joining protein LigD
MHWVTPALVAELHYIGWTPDAVLRHAVFLGLRDDKAAAEVVREPPQAAGAPAAASAPVVIRAAAPKKRKAAPRGKSVATATPAFIDKRGTTGGVKLTHPERELWPKPVVTKADLAAYWDLMADLALPHIVGRPLALVRCPDGISGEQFFQKKVTKGFPREILDLKLGDEQVIAIENAAGLRALAQMSAIEIHPWGATLDDIERPDRLVIDLDPDAALDFGKVIGAAQEVRKLLEQVGLVTFCKTTGGKGLHVVVPIVPEHDWAAVKQFAHELADWLARKAPDRFVADAAMKKRKGRIFVDYLRNGRGATAVAPFSPRARPGATFAMPLPWNRVKAGLDPQAFAIPDAADLKKAAASAWRDFFSVKQKLTKKALAAFRA